MTKEPTPATNPLPAPAYVKRLEDLIAKLTARIRRLKGAWVD